MIASVYVLMGAWFLRFPPAPVPGAPSPAVSLFPGMVLALWSLPIVAAVPTYDHAGKAAMVAATLVGVIVAMLATVVLARWASRKSVA